jgi:hypothetical protein
VQEPIVRFETALGHKRSLPISRTGVTLFFQLVTHRHEHASTFLTSNKGFEEWGDMLGDDVMAAALVDRLIHHCHVANIRGNNLRTGEHRGLATRPASTAAKSPPPRCAGPGGRRPEPLFPLVWAPP